MIFEEVAKEASNPSPSDGEGQKPPGEAVLPTMRKHFRIEDIGVQEPQRFMESYLCRYGVSKEALLILSIMVFLFSSTSVVAASKIIITQHKGEIEVLRSIGASKKTIKADLLIKLLPWSLISSAIGIILVMAALTKIQENGYLQVLSHKLTFQVDPLIVAVCFILASFLVSISVLRSDLE
jgi:ABC-type lipoprotein release transport system permease subunit